MLMKKSNKPTNTFVSLFLPVVVCPAGHRHHHAQQAELSAQSQYKLHPSEEQPRDPVWHPALCWSGLL